MNHVELSQALAVTLPDANDLNAVARYVCEAWEHPELRIACDLHAGMRRLKSAVDQKTASADPQLASTRRLFRIRLQNGNTVYLQADSEEQAIRDAGLKIDGSEIVQDKLAKGEDADPALIQYEMMQSGFGPQNFVIRECHDFHATFALTDGGAFEAWLDSFPAIEELYLDYPDLHSTEEDLSKLTLCTDEDDEVAPSQQQQAALAAAVLKEKTRLTAVL